MKTIIANWKSHKTLPEMQAWLSEFKSSSGSLKNHDTQVIIAPPMVGAQLVAKWLLQAEMNNVGLGVQDISQFPAGSYTGAVSTKNVEGLPVKYALVGHSERRRYFHETNQEVANKVDLALAAGITPVVCIDRDYLAIQMSAIPEDQWRKCMVAYEPLGAIGSGQEEPVEKVEVLVHEIQEKYHPVGVIYGGSVSKTSVANYLRVCDGVLVATHSLEVQDFLNLLKATP